MKQFYNIFSNEKDINQLYYYANEVKNRLFSKRQLEEIIKNKEYDRLPIEARNNLISEDIESFMTELGNSFSFMGSEYKIGDTYHKIDLLLFNVKYNAYVVAEL